MKTVFSLLLSLVLLGSTFSSAANAQTKNADWQTNWYQLVSNVMQKGQPSSTSNFAAFHFQVGTSFDVELEREVAYFTLIGKVDPEGRFAPMEVSTVSEKWTRAGTDWKLRQCIRVSDLYGDIKKIYARDLVLNKDRVLTESKSLPLRAIDHPAEVSAWLTSIEFWMAHGQSKPTPAPSSVLRTDCYQE